MHTLRRLQYGPTVSFQYFIMLCVKILTLLFFPAPKFFWISTSYSPSTHLLTHCLILQAKPLTQSLQSHNDPPANLATHSATTNSPTGWPTHSVTQPLPPIHSNIHPPTHINIPIHRCSPTATLTHSHQLNQKYTTTYRATHRATGSFIHQEISHSPTHWSSSTTQSVLSKLRRVYFEDFEVNFQALAVLSMPTHLHPYTFTLLHSCSPAPLHSYTPTLLHPYTPAPLHSCTPTLLHFCTPAPYTPAPLYSWTPTLLHPYTPAPLHSCTPTLLHSCTPASLHPYIPALLHPYTPTFLHFCTPTLLHPYSRAPQHSCTPTLLHPYTPEPLHSCTPTLLHPYTPDPLQSYTPILLNPYTPAPLHPTPQCIVLMRVLLIELSSTKTMVALFTWGSHGGDNVDYCLLECHFA
jgi:hypothetical protein